MGGRRSQARLYAVLALYQWQITGQDPAEIARQYFDDPEWAGEIAACTGEGEDAPEAAGEGPRGYDRELFKRLLYGVPANLEALDARLGPALDRSIERVDPVERAILRAGAFELLFSPQIPYRVAINEAVELAKRLGAAQGHRYVNGVLDRVARAIREEPAGPA